MFILSEYKHLFRDLNNVTLVGTKVHSVTNFKSSYNFIENGKLNLKRSFNTHRKNLIHIMIFTEN